MKHKAVSSLIKQYKPEFDPDGAIARRCAERDGITVDQVKEQWRLKGAEAIDRGEQVHRFIEKTIINEIDFKVDSNFENYSSSWYKWWMESSLLDANGLDITVKVEESYNSDNLRLWGIVDAVYETPDHIELYDWKTSEKYNVDNRFGGRMLEPIEHLHDCHFVHHSLQLELYKRLIQEKISKPIFCKVVVIKPWSTQELSIMDVSDEVDEILRLHNSH